MQYVGCHLNAFQWCPRQHFQKTAEIGWRKRRNSHNYTILIARFHALKAGDPFNSELSTSLAYE